MLDPVIIAAGDIADCNSSGDEATAALLASLPGTIVTLGDNAYESGTATDFANCYDPSWGARKSDTRPSPGNHEYNTPGAAGYYGYFGAAAGNPTQGWYSYDVGAWHVISLNSNCPAIGGCGAGSPQETWLRNDLASHGNACTLAYWHYPRFSSGLHGDVASMQPIWQALYDYGADVVLNGHDHTYERFAPQTPGGAADATFGIREFVVGTGGRSHYIFNAPKPNSEARNNDTYGVLALTLHDNSYDWQFVPEAGKSFSDTGASACHGPTLPDADADNIVDASDNCPSVANSSQANNDRNFTSNQPRYIVDDLTRTVSDGAGDACDADDDNDGLVDAAEASSPPCATASAATDPFAPDSDGDRVGDGAECSYGSDPASAASKPALPAFAADTDHDGLSDADEAARGTNPAEKDTDGDGLQDGWEVRAYASDPLSPDSDGDGVRDGCEALSLNVDTVINVGDQALLAAEIMAPPPKLAHFDLNRDGPINPGDQALQASRIGPGKCP